MARRSAGILAAALVLLLWAAMPAGAADSDRQVLHVLNRLAFGPNRADFDYVKTIGVERWIAEQLDPGDVPEPLELRLRLAQLDTQGLGAAELRRLYGPLHPEKGVKPTLADLRAQERRTNLVVTQAETARLLRAALSRRQLLEVMVDFWFNHFNIFGGEGLERIWIGDYEAQAIRPYALGHFRDLLMAVAKHPAMLAYLDATQNTASARTGADRLNENFAREVMELHTLGIAGGYTQDDVESLARVFTGWRVNPPGSSEFPGVAAVFAGQLHDYRPKVFLGRRLAAQGRAEGEEALAMLAASPATARHIAFELAQYFVADDPPPALVARLAARFLATEGDIRQVLASLFDSPEFWTSAGEKYKTPYEFVISAVRAAGPPLNNVAPLVAWLRRLGEPLYGCETPDGYKNTTAAWLSPEASMQRIAFAAVLAGGGLGLARDKDGSGLLLLADRPRAVDPKALDAILGAGMSAAARAVIAAAPPGERAALILGGPDFMRR